MPSLVQLTEQLRTSPLADTLPPHYTWAQVDSSKLELAQTCLRKYLYNSILGYTPERTSHHLIVGHAFHLGMDFIYHNAASLSPFDLLEGAYKTHLEYHRKYFTPADDVALGVKAPGNMRLAFELYIRQYLQRDLRKWEVLHNEIPGVCTIGEGRELIGRIDLLVRDRATGQIAIVDHKTASRNDLAWQQQWHLYFPLGTYTHMLYSIWEPEEVFGAVVNGIILRKPPESIPILLKDGTQDVYKRGPRKGELKFKETGGKGNEITRVEVQRTPDQQAEWLDQANYWTGQLETELERLGDHTPDSGTLKAFPKNTTNCQKYNTQCPYHGWCTGCVNPLDLVKRAGPEGAPPGFTKQYWDPHAHETVGSTPVKGSELPVPQFNTAPKGDTEVAQCSS